MSVNLHALLLLTGKFSFDGIYAGGVYSTMSLKFLHCKVKDRAMNTVSIAIHEPETVPRKSSCRCDRNACQRTRKVRVKMMIVERT